MCSCKQNKKQNHTTHAHTRIHTQELLEAYSTNVITKCLLDTPIARDGVCRECGARSFNADRQKCDD